MTVRLLAATLAAAFVFLPPAAQAGGLARTEHFSVFAEDQELAEAVAENAERFREEIALAWFGGPMEKGTARAIIRVARNDRQYSGFTALADKPERDFQRVRLEGPRDWVVGPVLRHELVHVLFAARFPGAHLPIWLEEGIAGCYDHPAIIARRRAAVADRVASGGAPSLARLTAMCEPGAMGQENYEAATSLVEYLLALDGGDRAEFLRFACDVRDQGPAQALARRHGVPTLAHLQDGWEKWVLGGAAAQPARSRMSADNAPRALAASRPPAAPPERSAASRAMTVVTR